MIELPMLALLPLAPVTAMIGVVHREATELFPGVSWPAETYVSCVYRRHLTMMHMLALRTSSETMPEGLKSKGRLGKLTNSLRGIEGSSTLPT